MDPPLYCSAVLLLRFCSSVATSLLLLCCYCCCFCFVVHPDPAPPSPASLRWRIRLGSRLLPSFFAAAAALALVLFHVSLRVMMLLPIRSGVLTGAKVSIISSLRRPGR